MQKMIQHTLIFNFLHNVCPLSSTTKSLSIYNTKPNIWHIMFNLFSPEGRFASKHDVLEMELVE